MGGLSAIVLAAGYASRMGDLKPLADLGGRTLLARVVASFASIGVEDVVVVTGHRRDDVAAAAHEAGARTVVNPRFADGMYSSVKAGAAAVPEGRRFFLLPVDCPLVRPETMGRLARAGAAAGAAVVLPTYGGLPGHPPLLAPELRSEILAGEPAGGLRELLTDRPEPALRVEVDDPGVVTDADTPADLERLRAVVAAEELPSERRCLELLRERGASEGRVAHSLAVAAVAAALAAALNERDQCLCVPLVAAAALLHDVARAEPRHAEAGAALLERLGYPRVAPAVRRHMRLGETAAGDLDEAQVVFLADKLVQDDRLAGLEARFAARLRRHAGDDDALEGVRQRLEEARAVQARVEAVLGRPLGV
ncbi:MAG: NTP transferase domain-containing protein [Actinobacteria bacterium]|nr:NTP transferase domain-containing protein [Actinomycetota bacterium]